jgi:ribosomal protein L25 (general stress protein Ctc)
MQMEQKTISAAKRSDLKKGAVGRLRRAGKIPAVIYGRKGAATPLLLDEKEFLKSRIGKVKKKDAVFLFAQADGKIIAVPQGYIADTKEALDKYKKEYSSYSYQLTCSKCLPFQGQFRNL